MTKKLLALSLCVFFLAGCSSLCGEPTHYPMGKTGEEIDHDYK